MVYELKGYFSLFITTANIDELKGYFSLFITTANMDDKNTLIIHNRITTLKNSKTQKLILRSTKQKICKNIKYRVKKLIDGLSERLCSRFRIDGSLLLLLLLAKDGVSWGVGSARCAAAPRAEDGRGGDVGLRELFREAQLFQGVLLRHLPRELLVSSPTQHHSLDTHNIVLGCRNATIL